MSFDEACIDVTLQAFAEDEDDEDDEPFEVSRADLLKNYVLKPIAIEKVFRNSGRCTVLLVRKFPYTIDARSYISFQIKHSQVPICIANNYS